LKSVNFSLERGKKGAQEKRVLVLVYPLNPRERKMKRRTRVSKGGGGEVGGEKEKDSQLFAPQKDP